MLEAFLAQRSCFPAPLINQARFPGRWYTFEDGMPIDPYALCPCGSGKKVKFCCHDLIGEIERIGRMIEGDQPRAALQHVEQALAKYPDRASLLDLKAMVEMSLERHEDAAATVDRMLKVDPKSPSGWAHRAMLLSGPEYAVEAADALQQALESVEHTIHQRVLESIGAVGHALLLAGEVVAARAHLFLYQAIAGEEDTRALSLLLRMNRLSGFPLLLRDQMRLREFPASHPAAAAVAEVCKLAAVGKWRRAAARCDELLPDHYTQPTLIYNRALLSGFLGDTKNFVAGLRLYARQQNVPHDDAVEAEAIAQLVDKTVTEASYESTRQVFAVRDDQALIEHLRGHDQIVNFPIDPAMLEETGSPPPRYLALLLDRAIPADYTELAANDVPVALGLLSVYGRQTDRPERLEFVLDRSPHFESHVQQLRTVAGEFLGELLEEIPATNPEEGRGEAGLSWQWHIPRDVPVEVRQRLRREQERVVLLEKWPAKPRLALGGKSPLEAAADPQLQLPLEAAVLVLEQAGDSASRAEIIHELRVKLSLSQPEPIEPASIEIPTFPSVRIPRVKLAEATDDLLLLLHRRTSLVDARLALVATAEEILRRPSMESRLDIPAMIEQLIVQSPDVAGMQRWLMEGRQWSSDHGQSLGRWDLVELELAIADSDQELAQSLLQRIVRQHGGDQAVMGRLAEILYSAGIIDEHGQPVGPLPPAGAPAEPAAGLWTPDAEAAPSNKPASKLWLPS